jgi:hypothetical protein
MESSILRSSTVGKTKAAGSRNAESLVAELTNTQEEEGPNRHIIADRVTTFVRGATAHSAREIESLINDLEALREKLVADSSRLEQDVAEFAALNQSVISLTQIISDSVSRAKAPNTAT